MDPRSSRLTLAVLLAATPLVAHASFGGGSSWCFGFPIAAAVGAVFALPTALALALVEGLAAKRRPSDVATLVNGVIGGVALLAGLYVFFVKPDRGTAVVLAQLVAPPFLAVAAQRLVPWARGVVLCGVMVGFWWLFARREMATMHSCLEDPLGLSTGAMALPLAVFLLVWALRHRVRLRDDFGTARMLSDEPLPAVRLRVPRIADAIDSGRAHLAGAIDSAPEAPDRGYAALAIGGFGGFLFLGLLCELGYTHWWGGLTNAEFQVRDVLGFAPPTWGGSWWSLRGLVWGMLFGGGVWALAAYVGLVDAGRLAKFRFAALLLSIVVVWIGFTMGTSVAEIDALERAASGLSPR